MWGGEVVYELAKVCTVDLIEGSAVLLLGSFSPFRESEELPSVVPPERITFRFDGDLIQVLSQTPSSEQPAGIRVDLNACADIPDGRGRFDDGYAVACLGETECSTQTTNTTTDHDDIEDE